MDHDFKNYNPYKGLVLSVALLIGIPFVSWFVVYLFMSLWNSQLSALDKSTARSLGLILGSMFHLACIIGGLLDTPFKVLIKRIKEFFELVSLSPALAFRGYWDNIKADGVNFLIFSSIIAANVIACVQSVNHTVSLF